MHSAVKEYLSKRNAKAARARWKNVTKEERSKIMKKVRKGTGKPWDVKGTEKLSPAQE